MKQIGEDKIGGNRKEPLREPQQGKKSRLMDGGWGGNTDSEE